MTAALRAWYDGLSRREQILMLAAGILAAVVLLVFALIRPGLSAIEQAELAHDEAVQRRGRIEATVETALVQQPVARDATAANIDLLITQGAAEKGFELIKSTTAAPGQLTFRMDQARAPALLAWLTELESQGVAVRSVTVRGGSTGSVTVEAQMQQVAR